MSKQLTPHQKEAIDYRKHISLTANAGSGKTFVLSKRFVEIYKNEDVELNSIVAITFTDKAAGELNKKIADEVEEQLSVEKNAVIKKRLEKLRRELVLANISTIHSFCINILKEFAPQAQIDTNFSPIDKLITDELIEQSIEDVFQSTIRDQDSSKGLMHLIRFLGSKIHLKKAIKDAVEKRRVLELLAKNIYLKSTQEIAGHFNSVFQNSFQKMFLGKIEELINNLKIINSFVLGQSSNNKIALDAEILLDEFNSTELIKAISKLFEIKNLLLTQKNTIRERGYLGKAGTQFISEIEFVENTFSELSVFEEIDLSGKADYDLALFGKEFIKVYEKVVQNYSAKKQSRSYLDFEDILLFTYKIISDDSVQSFLRDKYKFIMVDEYQDTNELQYEIIMPIVNYLQQGNLFVVGDEKQSIYMFRNAELEIFNKTKNEINNVENLGANLSLPHSFRMYPELVLFTNKLFGKLFASPQKEFNEVAPNDLICTKNLDEKGTIGILIADKENNVDESQLVASKIVELLKTDKTLQLGDISVLCRKRKHFSELEKTFAKYNLPFSIIGGKGFYQRQVVYDIYNYISFLLNEKDDQALVGLLRSPFYNLSDSKLLLISMQSGACFYEKLIKYSEIDNNLADVIEKLTANKNDLYSSDPYLLIRKLLNESGYWALLSSKPNSEQEIANVEKLIALARSHINKNFKNIYDFISTLKEYIDELEDEGQAQTSQESNAIKLMTIHQSKGLEFKVVFIYGTNNRAQDDKLKTRALSICKEYGLLTKVPLDKKYFENYSSAPITSLYNYKTKRKNEAELKRLFYVAVTRAVKYLFISSTIKEQPEKGSFYKLLCDGLKNNFQDENILLGAEVEFMKHENGIFINEKKYIETNISVEQNIKHEANETEKVNRSIKEKLFRNKNILDYPKHEVISATKISMFTQCPVKYELTYDIGYLPIMKLIKQKEREYEFQLSEEESVVKSNAQLRGKIIHKILCDEVDINSFDDYLINQFVDVKESEAKTLAAKIKQEIVGFYNSKSYLELASYSNYKNEYEVYCQEGEFYLYGIIDKLIIEVNKLKIVDYKTDSIEKDEILNRSENYFPQLKFYAYVLSKIYKEVSSFEIQLVYLKHPDEVIKIELTKYDIAEYGNIIRRAINYIHTFKFSKNRVHCKHCQYALEGNICVKPD